jgi:uncharacterized protein DUF3597
MLQALMNGIYGKSAEAILDEKAAAHHPKLDWRKSIVDLLELVGQPSDIKARDALAKELRYRGPLDGSAEMNDFLHAKVLDRLGIHHK